MITRTEVYLVAGGVVACALLSSVLIEIGLPGQSNTRQAALAQGLPEAPRKTIPAKPVAPVEAAPAGSSEARAILALATGAKAVPEDALLRLSGMVNIGNSLNAPPDKEAWRNALPVAKRLMQLPTDCGQQNWLRHFVETGEYAVADSDSEYRESAKVLMALGRNNAQEPDFLAKSR